MEKQSFFYGAGVIGILLYLTSSLVLSRTQDGKTLDNFDHAINSRIVKNCIISAVSSGFPLLCERLLVILFDLACKDRLERLVVSLCLSVPGVLFLVFRDFFQGCRGCQGLLYIVLCQSQATILEACFYSTLTIVHPERVHFGYLFAVMIAQIISSNFALCEYIRLQSNVVYSFNIIFTSMHHLLVIIIYRKWFSHARDYNIFKVEDRLSIMEVIVMNRICNIYVTGSFAFAVMRFALDLSVLSLGWSHYGVIQLACLSSFQILFSVPITMSTIHRGGFPSGYSNHQ